VETKFDHHIHDRNTRTHAIS